MTPPAWSPTPLGKITQRIRGAVLGPAARRRAELRARQAAYEAPAPVPAVPQVRAAVAFDERLRTGFAWEWTQHELTPRSWPATLVKDEIDLVVLQLAGGVVCGWDAADGSLGGMLDRCRELELPVFVWATGDPGDPEVAASWIERVHRVFVDSDQSLEQWRARWPEAQLDVLHPAAQPRLHNPLIGRSARLRPPAAVVAGGTVAGVDPGSQDPWQVDGPVAGPVVSGYRVLVDSRGGIDPWRAIAAAASNTSLVASAPGVDRLPADLRGLVAISDDDDALRAQVTARIWQPELADREAVVLGRATRARHTFANRVDVLAKTAGMPVSRPDRSVSIVIPTNRIHELDNAIANVARQEHGVRAGVELVLVLHGLQVRPAEIDARVRDAGIDQVTVLNADASLPLGACMNLGLDAAGGSFVAKMDDDNFYGRHYLTDLVAAFDYTDAGIVGKWAHYVWLRSSGAVVLRSASSEHRYERLVQGGSLVLRADVARALRFGDQLPRGVDTDILNRAQQASVLTYAADRFNYVSVRGPDRQAHTWTIDDAALLNRAGELVFYGDPREHVDV